MNMFWSQSPKLSVIVVAYRMRREVPRTLHSLSTAYQNGVSEKDYEVIVVENPSDQMLTAEDVGGYGKQFRYVVNPRPSRSPAAAINLGARHARGKTLLLMVDGARILSPGVLRHTLTATRLYNNPVVATLSWHLGPDNQARSIHEGYSQSVEDQLLATKDWQKNGYQLFEISALAGSCPGSWFSPILESNCLAVDRKHFRSLGGFSEEFQTAGGGFVNLDFYARAVSDPKHPLVFLMGEGTFHQIHGGAATNRIDDEPIREFQEEYQRLRGRAYSAPLVDPIFVGGMPEEAKPFMRQSIVQAEQLNRQKYPSLAGVANIRQEIPNNATGKSEVLSMNPSQPNSHTPATNHFSQILTVLGMHRSGTSCLAGTMMECGVDFGEVSRKNNFNLKGNNENQKIMDLQDRLLADNHGSWKEPPAEVRWKDEHREALQEIIDEFHERRAPWWGFKDPRTLLMLDGWRETLPNMHLVGIFRHPEAVAQSLTNRNLFSRQKGFDLWCHYNRQLLRHYQQKPFPILFFSPDADDFSQQLQRLVTSLGLVAPPNGFEFFEPSLQHFGTEEEKELPREVAEIYQQLHEVAFYRTQVASSITNQNRAA